MSLVSWCLRCLFLLCSIFICCFCSEIVVLLCGFVRWIVVSSLVCCVKNLGLVSR